MSKTKEQLFELARSYGWAYADHEERSSEENHAALSSAEQLFRAAIERALAIPDLSDEQLEAAGTAWTRAIAAGTGTAGAIKAMRATFNPSATPPRPTASPGVPFDKFYQVQWQRDELLTALIDLSARGADEGVDVQLARDVIARAMKQEGGAS